MVRELYKVNFEILPLMLLVYWFVKKWAFRFEILLLISVFIHICKVHNVFKLKILTAKFFQYLHPLIWANWNKLRQNLL